MNPSAGGHELLAGLNPAWRSVFEEAWASARAGNFGVGAVLVDPTTDRVVGRGRNRVAEVVATPGVLAGNMAAHAEINAFGSLTSFNADGLHLYTTLEPCLMCAAAAMQLKVAHVHVAAVDEFFVGLDALWHEHPLTAGRRPKHSWLADDPTGTPDLRAALAAFGRFLPMRFTLERLAGGSADRLAREAHPRLALLADRLTADAEASRRWRALDLDGSLTWFAERWAA